MGFPVYSTEEYISRLEALIADEYPGDLLKAKMRLFQNDVEPDANQVIETFIEADWAGYAAVALTMSAPSRNDQGLIVTRSNVCNFTSAAGVDLQLIYGCYVVDESGAKVIAAQRFDTPQSIGGVYPQAVSGVWRMSEPLTSYGWIDVES